MRKVTRYICPTVPATYTGSYLFTYSNTVQSTDFDFSIKHRTDARAVGAGNVQPEEDPVMSSGLTGSELNVFCGCGHRNQDSPLCRGTVGSQLWSITLSVVRHKLKRPINQSTSICVTLSKVSPAFHISFALLFIFILNYAARLLVFIKL